MAKEAYVIKSSYGWLLMQRLEDNERHNMSGLIHEAHEELISVQIVCENHSYINCWTELQ